MRVTMAIGVGLRRVAEALRNHFFMFCAPIVAVGVAFQPLHGTLHFGFKGWHLGLGIFLYLCVCMPIGMYAQTVVAAMYLRWRNGGRPTFAEAGEVLKYSGLGLTLARLTLLCIGWFLVALLAAVLLYLIPVFFYAIFAGLMHHGISPKPRFPTGVVVFLWLVSYGFFVSKYSFVLPLLAMQKNGDASRFRMAIQRAKQHLGLLRMVSVVEYGAVAIIDHQVQVIRKGMGGSRWNWIGLGIAGAILVGILTAYFEMLKTEMAAQTEGED